MKYKMIVSDFDGTLYNDDYEISAQNADAIKRYIDAGGRFVIATGRLFSGILPHARNLGLKDEVIAYQGGGIYDIASEEELYSNRIDNELAVEVLSYLYDVIGRTNCIPMFYDNDKCFTRSRRIFISTFARIVGIKPVYTKNRLDEFARENAVKPYKVLLLISKSKANDVANALRAKFGDRLSITRSSSVLIEMVNADSSKAVAVKWLADKYNIKPEEIITLGDAENDISMLRYAGLGVAMGNAMDSVKECADYIAPSNNDNGVAAVIEKFCLGEDAE